MNDDLITADALKGSPGWKVFLIKDKWGKRWSCWCNEPDLPEFTFIDWPGDRQNTNNVLRMRGQAIPKIRTMPQLRALVAALRGETDPRIAALEAERDQLAADVNRLRNEIDESEPDMLSVENINLHYRVAKLIAERDQYQQACEQMSHDCDTAHAQAAYWKWTAYAGTPLYAPIVSIGQATWTGTSYSAYVDRRYHVCRRRAQRYVWAVKP